MHATFAAMAALATLATLACGAVTALVDELPRLQYITSLRKGVSRTELDEPLGPFYILDGQCSGVLDDLLACTAGAPSSVRVDVRDSAEYPLVALHHSLRRASVVRAEPCRGEATVTVWVSCASSVAVDHPHST